MEQPKSKAGGKREGAGRKVSTGRSITIGARVTQHVADILNASDNKSEYICNAVEYYADKVFNPIISKNDATERD